MAEHKDFLNGVSAMYYSRHGYGMEPDVVLKSDAGSVRVDAMDLYEFLHAELSRDLEIERAGRNDDSKLSLYALARLVDERAHAEQRAEDAERKLIRLRKNIKQSLKETK